jgi:hypothetical protein
MVFSTLVDADRLDTEAFYAKAEGKAEASRSNWQPLKRLKQQIDQYMSQIAAKAAQTAENTGQGAVNLERTQSLPRHTRRRSWSRAYSRSPYRQAVAKRWPR